MIIIRVLRFFVIAALIYFLFKLLWKNNWSDFFKKEKKTNPARPLEQMKKDPICGTYIPESQALRFNLKKKTYYFCSEKCREEFKQQIKK